MFNLRRIQTFISQATPLLVAAVLCLPASAQAEAVGQFSATLNKVDHLRTGATEAVEAKVGSGVELKDLVTTLERSRAQVTFVDETVLRIASSSQVEVTEFMFDNSKLQSGSIKMIRGTLRSIVHHTDAGDAQFEVRTPTAVAAVRGTDFFTIVMGNITRFVCNQGQVEIRNINPGVAGAQMCAIGQTVDVSQGQPPTPPSPTDPKLLDQLIKATDIATPTAGDPSPPQGPGGVEEVVAATEGTGVGAAATALGVAAIGAVAVGSVSTGGVPTGAIPGAVTVTVEDSIYVMQAWMPPPAGGAITMTYGVPSGSDAGNVMTVTRNAGGNITSVRIQGTHATNLPFATATGAFDYTFNTAVATNELALGGAATDSPAAVGAGPNSVVINQIGNLPAVTGYQYASLFHWGVETTATPGNWLAGIGVFGTLTPVASVPAVGTATYAGLAQGWYYPPAATPPAGLPTVESLFTADLTANVDFALGEMAITTINSQTSPVGGPLAYTAAPNLNLAAPVVLLNAGANRNTFTAIETVTNPAGMAGTIQGGFFGPATKAPLTGANNVPANIGGSLTLTGGGASMVGVFVGQ
ncbi:FecR family protein [Mariprofundus aestuarium]|uniref:FecR family protein n=1 Tax=Mariprofundus aestuarium TaxID=1921086 RepID=A0A2K8L2H7_MARES|nr:FecR family protein [Mariprofundus aestuarium]ATX80051.1 FecR family protein [Mariprofundus aestuarium]